nr:uncharacterized protein LOC109154456 [Ipomoea trifida]
MASSQRINFDKSLSGARRSIGDGRITNNGFDPWLAIADSPFVSTELHESIHNVPVCSLFADDGSGWDVECVKDVFNGQDANAILNIPVSLHKPPDAWVWTGESKGNYLVKSCYKLLCGEIQQHEPWNLIWKLHDLPKELETTKHLFMDCQQVRAIWSRMQLPVSTLGSQANEIRVLQSGNGRN